MNAVRFGARRRSWPRADRLLNTIIKVLKSRKHDVIADHFTPYAKIGDERIKFRLRERQRASETKDKWGGRIYESTGEFVFVIDIRYYHRMEVTDGRTIFPGDPSSSDEYPPELHPGS